MKKFLRKFFVALFLFVAIFPQNFSAFSFYDVFKTVPSNSQKLIPAGHWIYDALEDIFFDCGKNTFATQSAPLAIAELRLYLQEIEYDALSDYAKKQYDRVFHYFENDKMLFSSSVISLGANIKITPELYFKSNDNIEWTDRYHFKDDFIVFPVYLSAANFVFIEGDFFFGRNYWSRRNSASDKWHNFPVNFNPDTFWLASEFDWPRTAYISFGIPINDIPFFNIQFGRGAKSIGNTQTGSIIYSPIFETDAYFSLSLFSPNIKYTLDVTQVAVEQFLYAHRIEFRFLKKIHITLFESAFINSSFELRYLNPFMFLHSFSFWNDYDSPDKDGNTCAFIGVVLDATPMKNLNIYALYAQNEIRAPTELGASSQPNSMGWQAGAKYNIPFQAGTFHAGIEGVYTLPWLYVKYTPDSSLVNIRNQVNSLSPFPVTSWIGTPFGPDSIAVAAKVTYEVPAKWSASFSYQFLAQGSNAFADFLLDAAGKKRTDAFYPAQIGGKEGEEKAAWIAAFHGPSPAQLTNRFTLEGTYDFSAHISAAAKMSYAFIFNNRNIADNTQQGVELAVSGTFKLY